MLTVGDTLPKFSLTAVEGIDHKTAFGDGDERELCREMAGAVAWPKDFTFVCPTEIVGFNELRGEFTTATPSCRPRPTATSSISPGGKIARTSRIGFPWLSDIKRELSTALGILDKNEGVALRATFIVDPQGIIRHVSVNDLSSGATRARCCASRCAADRRALPVQLAVRRRHPAGRLTKSPFDQLGPAARRRPFFQL